MKIHFVDELPKASCVHYCHFHHRNLNLPNGTYVDLKSLAQIHEKAFFEEIELWHSGINVLGLKESPLWWLTQGSRLMSWSPQFFTPLFFYYLLQIYLKENKIQEIYVLSAPKEVIELAPDFYTEITIEMKSQTELIKTKDFYNNNIKPYLAYIKHYLFSRLKPKKLEKRPYLIHTTLLNPVNFFLIVFDISSLIINVLFAIAKYPTSTFLFL